MNLIVNHQVKAALERFVVQPSHNLLLVGAEGSGKGALAQELIGQLLGLNSPEHLQAHPYFKHVQPKDGTTSIDTIRTLREFMKLKTTGERPIRRGVLMEDAHLMTTEAQNALLKLLEEPPSDTVLILTTPSIHGLLPTVRSRMQTIDVKPPTKAELLEHFGTKGHKPSSIEPAYYIADGQPGLMTSLLDADSTHSLVGHIATAKQLLSAPVFERLTQIDALAKQKTELPGLLMALRRVCRAALHQAAIKDRQIDVERWNRAIAKIIQAEAALPSNPGAKLLLTDLLLNL